MLIHEDHESIVKRIVSVIGIVGDDVDAVGVSYPEPEIRGIRLPTQCRGIVRVSAIEIT
jgi:hypothetical protein